GPDEQNQVEERLLVDDEYTDLLLIVEDEIIESDVSGALPEPELKWMAENFFCSPDRRSKLRFAKTVARTMERHASKIHNPVESPKAFISRIRGRQRTPSWRPSPTLVMVATAALLAIT